MTRPDEHAGTGEQVTGRGIEPEDGEVRPEETEVTDDGIDPAVGAPVDGAVLAASELASQVAERTADLQRVTAEYANYRRRVDRDREAQLVSARVQFVSELLTVLDDIERADSHGDLNGPFKSVADKVVAVAQKQGLEAFGLEGEPFDPSVHEAVQHEESAVTGPTVTVVSTVLRRGYRIADRILRPAMVAVVDQADDAVNTVITDTTEQQ